MRPRNIKPALVNGSAHVMGSVLWLRAHGGGVWGLWGSVNPINPKSQIWGEPLSYIYTVCILAYTVTISDKCTVYTQI